MKERHIIIGVLRELGRRLWINRAIRDAAFVTCVILFCLVCFQLIEPALIAGVPSTGTATRIALLAAFAAVTVEVVRHSARGVSTRQAAAEADARAQLKDELKSAHWFLSELESSPFAELQVQRAAATAARLDLAILAPRTLPINAFAAGGLGLLLAALMWMTPQLSRSWDSSHEASVAEHSESADLRSLLKDAPHDAEIEKLDLALRKLQQTDASAEQKRRALADARDAIDQANMEASAVREGLARLAESLKANPKFEAAAHALNQGSVDEAMELLRKLKAGSAAASARENRAIEPADKGSAPESNIGQALESAGRDLASRNAAVNQDAINRVINALEQANERMEVQNRVNSVKRRMENNLIATTQRGTLTASQFDNYSNAANPTPSPETGNSNMRGGTLFRQAAVAREENDNAREGSQTGDASGDSAALPLEGAAIKRLDAQLKLETFLQQDEVGEEPNGKGDQGWFYSASREQKSTLQIENVRSRASYDREDAITHDRVPVRQKNIVKNYFLNLHESEK
ncbi:MAG: hypothetical protein HY067_13525 [Betaproteobacteria bacterium]|nr:hypothetical protein [Betaproteobacteria bacterium]